MYHCRHTNFRRASRLYRVLFATKTGYSAEKLLAADLLYCTLVVSQQTSHRFMLFTRLDRVLFSRLKCSVEQVLTADLYAHAVGAGRLLIARSTNNITGPTDAKTEPGYKLNCTWVGQETSHPRSNHPKCHVLTTQFADSACSNYTIC